MNVKKLLIQLKRKFAKTNKHEWLFYGHNGGYSENTRALSETVHKMYPEIEIVWGIDLKNKNDLPEYVKYVDLNSDDFLIERSKANVIIDNVFANAVFTLYKGKYYENFKKRIFLWLEKKDQKLYGLWHGIPLKKMGKDQFGNEDISGFLCNNLTVITGNDYTGNILRNLSFNKLKTITIGLPRNDILYNKKINTENIKKRLGLPTDKNILLYAPTFRNDGKDTDIKNVNRSGINQLSKMNISKILETFSERFGGEWVLVCRFHYHVCNMVDWDYLYSLNDRIYNGNIGEDMADYLICSDALITDYSSVVFDFALTEKPCFMFADDYDNYLNKERGFYVNIKELPFSFCESQEDLIESIHCFNDEKYKIEVNEMLKEFGVIKEEKASELVAKYIYDDSK